MKTILTLFLLSAGFGALAQQSVSRHITTDGQQLRIRVDIEQPGRSIHYRRLFDVTTMDAGAVKALENRIIDSLDRISRTNPPMATDQKQAARNGENPEQQGNVWRDGERRAERLEAHATTSLLPGNLAPSSVLVREDKENGRLWMQYTFRKDGEELIIERTANVAGKSEREKQAIINETEHSFGIKTGNQ